MNEKEVKEILEEKEKFLVTMTVREIKEVLQKYEDNTKVFLTWESTVNPVLKNNFYMSKVGTLYIDGDYNFYKKDFAKDELENERD